MKMSLRTVHWIYDILSGVFL